MRTLNDIFVCGRQMSAIQTADNASPIVVSPDSGRVVGIVINVHTVIDAKTTFDILKNNTDTTVDATLPNATADESGVIMDLDGVVEVEPGDALHLTSNGEQVAATTADLTWIIRR